MRDPAKSSGFEPSDSESLYTAGMSTIGARLLILRNRFHLTQEELGELCTVTKASVSLWESDGGKIPTDRVLQLRQKLNFSIDWLLHGDGAAPAADELSGDEALLCALYRRLDKRGRRIVMLAAKSQADER